MTAFNLACIAEGEGEARAVPVLLERLRQHLTPDIWVNVRLPIIRQSRNKLANADGIESAVKLAARLIAEPRAILVLIDADKACPKELGLELLGRARKARSDIPTWVVVANCEYENWFIAAAESLGGQKGLPENLETPSDVERIRDAKGWLSKQMPIGYSYNPTEHQAFFTKAFNLEGARQNSRSFRKLCSDFQNFSKLRPGSNRSFRSARH